MQNEPTNPLRWLLEIDRVVHEPARLAILILLSAVEQADFLYILGETGLSKGNLSSHVGRLEEAGYVEVTKEFVDKVPRTVYQLTPAGARALDDHRKALIASLG